MPEITRLNVTPRMSGVVIHGDTVYVSGRVAGSDAGPSVAEQTRDILAQIDAALDAAGTSRDHLLQATVWLADIGRIAEMNTAWDEWVRPGHAPARACVEARLFAPRCLVEVAVVAAR